MSAQDNIALAKTIYQHFNANQLDKILPLATEDVEATIVPFGQTFRGQQGFLDFMRGYRVAMPDVTVNLTNQVATHDHIVSEFIGRGTHTGPLMTPAGPVPATGRTLEYPIVEVWQIRNGKLAALRSYFDSATVMRQLGLMP